MRFGLAGAGAWRPARATRRSRFTFRILLFLRLHRAETLHGTLHVSLWDKGSDTLQLKLKGPEGAHMMLHGLSRRWHNAVAVHGESASGAHRTDQPATTVLRSHYRVSN